MVTVAVIVGTILAGCVIVTVWSMIEIPVEAGPGMGTVAISVVRTSVETDVTDIMVVCSLVAVAVGVRVFSAK